MQIANLDRGVRILNSGNSIAEFVQDLTSSTEAYSGPERRAAARYAVIIPVKVTPLSHLNGASGPSFQAVTRDISTSGVSILCLERTEAEHVLLEFAEPKLPKVQIVLEVRRCRPHGLFWEIAGQFVD